MSIITEDVIDYANQSNEELVARMDQISDLKEELDAELSVIKDELMDRLEKEGRDSFLVNGRSISKVIRKVWSGVSIETAQLYGAVKEEIKTFIDTKVLDAVASKGIKIEGMVETVYLNVRTIKKPANAEEN